MGKVFLAAALVLLLFQGSPAAVAAAPALSDGTPEESAVILPLDLSRDQYTVDADHILFQVKNNTGERISVILAPRLERETPDGAWEHVELTEGFCGVPDSLEPGKGRQGYFFFHWCREPPEPGHYRLLFYEAATTVPDRVLENGMVLHRYTLEDRIFLGEFDLVESL